MADEKSNWYDYMAFTDVVTFKEGEVVPTDQTLRCLGLVEARDPDHALVVAAEKWPPKADEACTYHVTLASKWRSQAFRAIATVDVEPILASAGGDDGEPQQ